MQTGVIIQARMSSKRFPGKVLYKTAGKPLLGYLLERLEHCQYCDKVVVATSAAESDDDIEKFCDTLKVNCYRGSLENVAERFKDAAIKYDFDSFVRICADSPLLDYRLIDRLVEFYVEGEFDLVTNTLKRTFPKGQSVEVLRRDTFEKAFNLMKDPLDHEHVTRYFYNRPGEYKICNLLNDVDYSWLQLTIDKPEDIAIFDSIVGKMDRPHWEYSLEDILGLWNQATCDLKVS